MTYEQLMADVAKVVEATGASVLVFGGALALAAGAVDAARPQTRARAYGRARQMLGRVILLGLEILIVGDIIRTIVVDPSISSAAVLAIIVLIRVVLSFSLEAEIDGEWPWNRWRHAGADRPDT